MLVAFGAFYTLNMYFCIVIYINDDVDYSTGNSKHASHPRASVVSISYVYILKYRGSRRADFAVPISINLSRRINGEEQATILFNNCYVWLSLTTK